jgi:hypothetical protein
MVAKKNHLLKKKKKKKKNLLKVPKSLLKQSNQSTLLTTRQLMVAVAKKNHLLKNLLRLLPTLPLTTTAAVVRLEPAAEDTIVVLHLHDLDLLDVRLLVDLVDVCLLVSTSSILRVYTWSTSIVLPGVAYRLEKLPKTIRIRIQLYVRLVTLSSSQSPFFARNEKEDGSSHIRTGRMLAETRRAAERKIYSVVLGCTLFLFQGSFLWTGKQLEKDTLASTCFGVSNQSNPDVPPSVIS